MLVFLLTALCASGFAEEYAEGARGEEIEQIQQQLADLGYLTGTVDGIYGKQTTTAVRLFQQLNGLEQTGTVDAGTYAALFSAQAKQLPEGLERGAFWKPAGRGWEEWRFEQGQQH